jgi:hypothetical protein
MRRNFPVNTLHLYHAMCFTYADVFHPMHTIYVLLDIFFVIFHTSLTLFNALGWAWKKTRVWNLVTLLLTGSSWLFLGMIVGVPGYCPLTDWHFNVLEKLGKTNLPNSYLKYLFDRITGLNIDPWLVDRVTLIVFVAALVVSVFLNLRDKILSKRLKRNVGD